MAQSVKCLTLDFSSRHDLTAGECEPRTGLCVDSMEPAWDSLSPRLSALPCSHTLFLKNKETLIKKFSDNLNTPEMAPTSRARWIPWPDEPVAATRLMQGKFLPRGGKRLGVGMGGKWNVPPS